MGTGKSKRRMAVKSAAQPVIKPAPPSGAGRISLRDRVLLGILAALAVVFVATWPMRARMARETARIEQETARRQSAQQSLDRLNAAVMDARKRMAAEPQSYDAHLALAEALHQQRDYPEALRELDIAEKLQPRSAEVHTIRGDIYDATRQTDLAVQELSAAVALDPNNGPALAQLAYKYVSFGWNQDAAQLLERALKALPDDPHLHAALAMAYFQNNNLRGAEQELLTARHLAPGDPTLIGPLVEVYRHAQRYDEALQAIDEAMRTLPDKATLAMEQAQVYLDKHDPDSAIVSANLALQLAPDKLHAYYIRAAAEKMLGQTEAALRDLEHIRAQDPGVDQTLLLLGQLYRQQGQAARGAELEKQFARYHAAADTFSHLSLRVSSQPRNADAHLALGRYYQQQGNTPRALVELKRTLELRPGDAEARRLLIQALQAAGRSAEAGSVAAGGSNR